MSYRRELNLLAELMMHQSKYVLQFSLSLMDLKLALNARYMKVY